MISMSTSGLFEVRYTKIILGQDPNLGKPLDVHGMGDLSGSHDPSDSENTVHLHRC